MVPLHRAVYLTGPTASGKTEVGVWLARLLNAEIIAMDSMTLYRGMDIGTAKPTLEERGGVSHHLIDMIDPWQSASVAQYRNWAEQAVQEIEGRGRLALFVGGTALYLKALLRGLFEGPGAHPVTRERLEQEAKAVGSPALHRRLSEADPALGARLHPNDLRRIIRALEVIELTGQPLSTLQKEHQQRAPETTLAFALERSRQELYERINVRVSRMFDAGLVAEVRGLLSAPRPIGDVSAQAVGYREVIAMLAGRTDLPETMDLVRTRSRQFAKRQGTWFRGLAEVRPWPLNGDETAEEVARSIARTIEVEQGRGGQGIG